MSGLPADDVTIDPASERNKDAEALARLLFGENAVDITDHEAMLIGDSVLNRVRSKYYPGSIAGVLYAENQYSPFNPEDPNYERIMAFNETSPQWPRYYSLAEEILNPTRKRSNVTHYYANSINPAWGRTLLRSRTEGRHTFGVEDPRTRRRKLDDAVNVAYSKRAR